MNFFKRLAVNPGSHVDLSKINPGDTMGWSKHDAQKQTAKNQERIEELQELLYAEHGRNFLLVLQGMDTAGKDGTIKAIAGAMNPQGVRIASFKKPTPQELSHHFLWRIEKQMPAKGAKGEVVFFNRSQYEDVLVVRVHNLVPEAEWSQRYDEINAFEAKHTANGTHILKFFLHISPEEQLERLKARLDDPTKHWKASENDFAERKYWAKYQKAYEAALSKCSTTDAPWIIVPADHKWFRDLVISEITVRYLEGLHMQFPDNAATIEKSRIALAEEEERARQAKQRAKKKPQTAFKNAR
jgi:PPK2 family polyphosphate:nucleotide phosphotransferase